MKVTCNVIKDLLILNETDSVSKDSEVIIEEHLSTCEDCQNFKDNLKLSNDSFIDEETKKNAVEEQKVLKKKFAKIKKHWLLSLIITIIVLPILIFILRLTKNQIFCYGLSFTNFDEVHTCKNFFKLIEDADYEEAVKMMNFKTEYDYIMKKKENGQFGVIKEQYGDVFDMSYEEFEKYMIEETITELENFYEKYSIESVKFYDSSQRTLRTNNLGEKIYTAHPYEYTFNIKFSNGENTEETNLRLEIIDGKIALDQYSTAFLESIDAYYDFVALFKYKNYVD